MTRFPTLSIGAVLEHKAERVQYATLRDKIRAEKAERVARYAKFEAIVAEAHAAGDAAAHGMRPVPMVVQQLANPFDDASAVVQEWVALDGACGFAWISFEGNTSFGRWMKKTGRAKSHYPTGLCVWVSDYGQSIGRKEAYASAYAEVLRRHDIKAYAGSRLD